MHYPDRWKQSLYYLNPWPVQYPMLLCYETDIISQFTQQKSQPKSIIFKKQFQKVDWWSGSREYRGGALEILAIQLQPWVFGAECLIAGAVFHR
jgi:hypothetical protein